MNASETRLDLSAVSESDERALMSNLYVSPREFPPLEIHLPGENGLSLLSNQHGHALTSVAGCRECMTPAPHDGSEGEGDADEGRSDETAHALEDNTSSTSLSPHMKRKRRRRASSGVVQGNPSTTRSPKVAASMHRAKGKAAQKARLSDANRSYPVEILDKSPDEGRDREVACMFTERYVQRFADDICCYPNAQVTI